VSATLPGLTPAQASLFLTLCGRALDSRAPQPFLGDAAADDVLARIGYDCSRFPMPASSVTDIALRAKKLDRVVRRFVARHTDAVVLDLGAGLDSRMTRVAPPAGVDWYDVDFPEVIALRAEAVEQKPKAETIATDLTEPGWLDAVPTGRPAVIVADGLVAFLAQDAFVTLLHRLVDHFPSGEIAFNGYTRFHTWVLKRYRGTASIADGFVPSVSTRTTVRPSGFAAFRCKRTRGRVPSPASAAGSGSAVVCTSAAIRLTSSRK